MRKFIEVLKLPSVALGAIGIAIIMIVFTFLVIWYASSNTYIPTQSKAIITIIPWSTSTLIPTTTSTPDLRELITETPTLRPDETGIGSIVQIVGTLGDGLNIRTKPGLTSEINFLGYDEEIFEIRDGPVEKDGIIWWYLVTPLDTNRAGWAAVTYLIFIANP